jgi:predicted aldo/keto reductase-like oxidoreductase
MTTKEDLEQVFAPGGAMEAFIEAREQGLTRYIGFSAHSVEIALALMDRFDFDTVLFPLNWVNFFNANPSLRSRAGFGPQVIAKAKSKNMGILALKAMARTQWAEGQERTHPKCWYQPVTDPVESELAIRFTLSEPITAAVTPGHVDLFRRAMDVAENFKPLSESERAELRRRAEGLEPIFRLA